MDSPLPLQILQPPADLTAWVEGGVIVRGEGLPTWTRFPSMLESQLVIRLSGHCFTADHEAVPAAAWLGAAPQARAFRQSSTLHAVGLILRASTAPLLMPATRGASGLHAHLPAAELLGAGWTALEAAVRFAPSDEVRLQLMFHFVRQRVRQWAGAQRSVRTLDTHQLAMALRGDLDAARRQLGLSLRQLERRSVAEFGVGPKQFQSLARFKRSLLQALVPGPSSAALALDQGYYDQSHWARSVRQWAGTPLRTLQAQAHAGAEHWPLAAGRQLWGGASGGVSCSR